MNDAKLIKTQKFRKTGSMSTWGVFDHEGLAHIAPCDKNGKILAGHEFSEFCECRPYFQNREHLALPPAVIHRVES